jgi:hypothetical protein
LPGIIRDIFDYRLLPPGDTLIFREFTMLMQNK